MCCSKEIEKFAVYIPLVGNIFPLQEFGTKAVAILCIGFLISVNYIGVVFGGIVQTIVTIIKIASIVLLSVLIIMYGNGSYNNVYNGFSIPHYNNSGMLVMIGLALSGAFWAYDGWNNVTFISGEIKNPKRSVPLALLFGTLIVIIVYVAINVAYLYILPVKEMANSPLVAATAAEKVFGPTGAFLISLIVIISTFGAVNGSILSTTRIIYAVSKAKLFFKSMGKVHPRYRTPYISLLVTGFWSSVLVLTGTFDIITDYVMFATWLFYALGAYGVFILRKKMPDTHRPYKVWGYPYTPAIFVIFSLIYLFNTVISDTSDAMMGLLLIILGLPIYIYWKLFTKRVSEDR